MTLTFSKMLPQDDYEIKYYIVGREKGPIIDFIEKKHFVGLIQIRNIWDFTTLRIYKIMKREKPYAVFCSLAYLNIRVILASKMLGNVKSIVRNDNMMVSFPSLNKCLIKLIYRFADRIVLQQEEMKKEVTSFINNESKCIVLHNPLDTQLIDEKLHAPSPYPADNSINYVYTARYTYNKGQDILLKAFKRLRRNIDNAHLYLVGRFENDDYYKSLIEYVQMNELTSYVHIVGYDNNPYKWMKYANCFVLPSRMEGLPNSLIEAMYIGTPVVATMSIPVISRIVKDGYNGYLVKSEDIDGLSKRMIDVLSLENFTITYIPASKEDVVKLFI